MEIKNIDKKIEALEFALDYIPGADESHSHSYLLELLEDLREKRREET